MNVFELKKKPCYYVVGFSGGKDSTAMLLRLIELNKRIDEVVCCDTYKEFPAMYRHIEKIKNVVESKNIKFTMLRSENSFDYLMFEKPIKRKNPKYNGLLGFSWAGPRMRWCTSRLKVDVINKHFSELKSKYNVIQFIGIAVDEEYRLERQYAGRKDVHFPLVDWAWDEKKCLDYCYSKGYNWDGLYNIFNRVSCWCCPLQSLDELRKLRTFFPDLWEELKIMDNKTHRKFRADYSVEELEKRFIFEEERKKAGLSITNRDFFIKLKEWS